MIRNERGVVLLEVIIALTILSVSGLSMTALVSAGFDVQRQVEARELELRSADRVLAAYALLTRDELDLRLGQRKVGEFRVTVQRPDPALYRVGVASDDAPDPPCW